MGVDVEKYAYYVNKISQNVDLETWVWRQIVTSQTAHTKCKWPPYATEWTQPHENLLRTPLWSISYEPEISLPRQCRYVGFLSSFPSICVLWIAKHIRLDSECNSKLRCTHRAVCNYDAVCNSDARIEQYVTIKINSQRSRKKRNCVQSRK